jgi:hypothetical protein
MGKLVKRYTGDAIVFKDAFNKYLSPPKPEYEPQSHRDGGEGFCAWCNENVCVPIYPPGSATVAWTLMKDLPTEIHHETQKSYASMWWTQQNIYTTKPRNRMLPCGGLSRTSVVKLCEWKRVAFYTVSLSSVGNVVKVRVS